ncbi:MAG: HAMP domain-containing histidine kinase [Clostridiales bacterium]|uniref:sensor histidine kinase n=1 Tax=Clostridium sp. N3C TaxID=1776758 RepID=UPI00092E1254|nr:HAMP domain-containing sensor histidine kinase [Clostridium sp. N3C]NLZ48770.1 HAMP domain-containing histidine kinase [Clostridiales bacterium]SCN24358.1 Alkaline phosphatase synthesis sensor protein PhoR [Clostridium sp. N3C]
MFKQLRNKFLILNLVIISIMMLAAFASIYLINYNNVRRDINMEMNRLLNSNKKMDPGPMNPKLNSGPYGTGKIENFSPGPSISFTLAIDSSNNIINYSSIYYMGDDFYELAKEKALTSEKNSGRFKFEDAYWEFLVSKSPVGSSYKIVFLDVTNRYNDLRNLIYTFSAVALITLVVIFFISRFFSNKAIEPIKEAFDKQKQFIADASHELKTPLAVINTNADALLLNSEDTINNQAKWVYYIKSEVERMSKLTNDLLYLAQVDNSDIKLVQSDFDLSQTVEEVILTMEAAIFEKDRILDYNIEPNLIVKGNNAQIKQIVMILLDNALKYSNAKGKISLSLTKNNNKAILSVSNTGAGIPKEHLNQIFNRFYRVDKSRSKTSGGYGLGLAIAKSIVDQHKGKISVKSIENQVTTFTVELPRAGNIA